MIDTERDSTPQPLGHTKGWLEFVPSPDLKNGLDAFVLPEKREGYHPKLFTNATVELDILSGGGDHHRYSDAAAINLYENRLKEIQERQIGVGPRVLKHMGNRGFMLAFQLLPQPNTLEVLDSYPPLELTSPKWPKRIAVHTIIRPDEFAVEGWDVNMAVQKLMYELREKHSLPAGEDEAPLAIYPYVTVDPHVRRKPLD